MYKQGILSLIGAGPGDPELITLKGVRLLGEADVVLYDALASDQLLQYAPQAEHIYVGKRKGCAAYLQEHINDLILQRGAQGKHVVRLKGGDPFVFGRGGEEMILAAASGMEVRVIPGISSSLAVPASEHIPLTQRGISESFWVVTGTTKDHKLSSDVSLAAQSSATVVILMGMSKLEKIMACFRAAGKATTPVAVLQEGTTDRARRAFGTVDNIAGIVAEKGLGNPAVIVIGEVVKLGLPQYTYELAKTPRGVQL